MHGQRFPDCLWFIIFTRNFAFQNAIAFDYLVKAFISSIGSEQFFIKRFSLTFHE